MKCQNQLIEDRGISSALSFPLHLRIRGRSIDREKLLVGTASRENPLYVGLAFASGGIENSFLVEDHAW